MPRGTVRVRVTIAGEDLKQNAGRFTRFHTSTVEVIKSFEWHDENNDVKPTVLDYKYGMRGCPLLHDFAAAYRTENSASAQSGQIQQSH
eukprot:scaffold375327_cov19-Prasinocladus_malaysianus.AAC.1